MTDIYKPPYGTYTNLSGSQIVSAAGKTAISANLAALKVLIKPAAGTSAGHPDFDHIPAATAQKICDEIDGVMATITAAPTS